MPIISPNNMVRDVEYADAASNQDETIEETTDETQTPANSHNYPATGTPVNAPFHIDLTDKSLGNSPGVGLSPGDNVEVRVVMTKSAPYTFDTSEGYLGIGVPDASKTNICNAKIHFRSNGLQTLTFLVTRAASGTAVKPLEPFNLVIDVPGDIDTPMFIDPKILNPG